jgi:drug/metabolite transporter (DMT)-like permease
MQSGALILFAVFALVLVGIYMAIRRAWFPPGITSTVGVVVCMILMVMISLAQQNSPLQAVVVGVLLGGVFSGATLAAAWYFHAQELHARYPNPESSQYDDPGQVQ